MLNNDDNEDKIDLHLNTINDEENNEFEDSLNTNASSKNAKVKIMVNKKHIDNKSSNAFILKKDRGKLHSSKDANMSLSSASTTCDIAGNSPLKKIKRAQTRKKYLKR